MRFRYVKVFIGVLWCLWIGCFLGGLATPLYFDATWPAEIAREVARNHAAAYSKLCRVSLFFVIGITMCLWFIGVLSRFRSESRRVNR
jgi:hypothetical protein